jgi:hypothetical protein
MATQISLKNLLVPSKTVEVEYPGMPGFKINISFLTREILSTIRKKSTKTTFKNRQPTEELNDDIFLELYVREAVKGWSGLKLSYLEQLAPIDLSNQDMNTTLDFSEENALYLMKSSSNFDAFISEQVTDLGNFSTNNLKK